MKKNEFMIGGYLAPKNTKEAYLLAKDCGINTMYLLGAPGWLGDDEQVEAVRICKEVGMDAIPVVWTKNLVIYDERLLEFDNIPAITLWDEPPATKFPLLVEKLEEFYAHYPKTMRCEINLLPSYTPLKGLATNSYFEYVQKYVEEVHSKMQGESVLSIDFYPLFKREEGIVVTPMWLPCLSIIAHFAVKKNLPMHCFIQTMPFAIGNDVVQTFELLRFQFMVYLAFGFSSFTHFCYASPGISNEFLEHQEAIVGRNGKPTELYKSVQKVNSYIQTFAKQFLPYTYLGTAKVSPENLEAFEGWADNYTLENTSIKSFDTDSAMLIGSFKNNEGKEAFFITNYALPTEKIGKCTLSFSESHLLRVSKDGVINEITTECFEVQIETGNGIFVEIIK